MVDAVDVEEVVVDVVEEEEDESEKVAGTQSPLQVQESSGVP